MNGFIDIVRRDNPWWESGAIPREYKSKKRRVYCSKVLLAAEEWFRDHKVLLMEGPRQVGKTMILRHIIDEYLGQGYPPELLIYIDAQDPELDLKNRSLRELIQNCLVHAETRLGPMRADRPPLILLDEIQYADRWSDWLKVLADRADFQAKIIATGSALRLSRGTRESGVGRWKIVDVPHLSFFEYIDVIKPVTSESLGFPDLPFDWNWRAPDDASFQKIKNSLPFERLQPLFNEYLAKGGYPDPAGKEEEAVAQEMIREEIVSRVLQDPVDLKIVRGKLELQRLFYYLATHTAEILSKDTISKESGLNRQTLNDYMQCLTDIHLIATAPLYKNDGTQALKSHDKAYVASPCITSALRPFDARSSKRGLILESAVVSHILPSLEGTNGFLSYWRERPNGQEVDIVAHWSDGVLPIEVKSSGKKSGMLKFIENYESEIMGAYLLKDQNEWEWSSKGSKPGVIMPIAHFLYMLGYKEKQMMQGDLERKRDIVIQPKPIEIFLPEEMTDLKVFQKKIRNDFSNASEKKPFFRLVVGPEKLLKTMWTVDRSVEPFFQLLRYPPRIRDGIVGDWNPGVGRFAEPVIFSEGIKAETTGWEKRICLYFNGSLEFSVPIKHRIFLIDEQSKQINPYSLVEYTVNFMRLFKKTTGLLDMKEPYWFELDIINAENLELRAGHPKSEEYQFSNFVKKHRFGSEPFVLSGRIPELNSLKPDIEAFQVLKNLYFQLGLGEGLPFFDKDGTCRIQ